MSLTLEEFKENYNYAPLLIEEFAEGASNVEDCPELVSAAKKFLDAQRKFIKALETVDVEIG